MSGQGQQGLNVVPTVTVMSSAPPAVTPSPSSSMRSLRRSSPPRSPSATSCAPPPLPSPRPSTSPVTASSTSSSRMSDPPHSRSDPARRTSPAPPPQIRALLQVRPLEIRQGPSVPCLVRARDRGARGAGVNADVVPDARLGDQDHESEGEFAGERGEAEDREQDKLHQGGAGRAGEGGLFQAEGGTGVQEEGDREADGGGEGVRGLRRWISVGVADGGFRYIRVDEERDAQLFYYFMKSERSPGCSFFSMPWHMRLVYTVSFLSFFLF
ncbi:hypothetical protein QJS04_geneDACA024904 [Acorus gramineus]|uniref:Uncharacterized protein n=1 Tax=Acorus gramineus TaxID=55184 RepID=A0AAV9A2B3_ACOGR|nr:hypothetical protein QJS04_geneDACA024904 [Acorus gramineus]